MSTNGPAPKLGWRVRHIEWSTRGGGAAAVVNAEGDRIEARAAIVTVPVAVLRRPELQWSPPLPTCKADAINGLNMSGAAKLWLITWSLT